jgi:hypothetical protein
MNQNKLTPSWRELTAFLRCLSQHRLSHEDASRLTAFAQHYDIPWAALAAQAEMEGVAGLIYVHLAKSVRADVPPAIMDRLGSLYRKTGKEVQTIISIMQDLAVQLAVADIPVMAIQGLSLIDLYGDDGIRSLGDVDLMVHPCHKKRFKELLREVGATVPASVYPDLLYMNDVWIDVHTDLLGTGRIRNRRHLFPEDLEPLWERAEPLFGNNRMFLRPALTDNLMALSAHALKHGYSRLIWVVDLLETIRQLTDHSAGWEAVLTSARFWRQERVLSYTFLLLEKYFNLRVPEAVKQAAGGHRLNALESYLLRLKAAGFSSDLICPALGLFNLGGGGRKIAFLKETVFPRRDVMAQIGRDNAWSTGSGAYLRRLAAALSLVAKDLEKAVRVTFRPAR